MIEFWYITKKYLLDKFGICNILLIPKSAGLWS